MVASFSEMPFSSISTDMESKYEAPSFLRNAIASSSDLPSARSRLHSVIQDSLSTLASYYLHLTLLLHKFIIV